MFLDLSNMSLEELLQKRLEIGKRYQSAQNLGMTAGVLNQLMNMTQQVDIQIQAKQAQMKLEAEREKMIEKGKDPDSDSLDIE
jgi:hypothetical protein